MRTRKTNRQEHSGCGNERIKHHQKSGELGRQQTTPGSTRGHSDHHRGEESKRQIENREDYGQSVQQHYARPASPITRPVVTHGRSLETTAEWGAVKRDYGGLWQSRLLGHPFENGSEAGHLNGEYSVPTKNSDITPPSFSVSDPPAFFSDASFAASQSGSFRNAAKLSLAASTLLCPSR